MGYMKVKVSKRFADFINATASKFKKEFHAELRERSLSVFEDDWDDFNSNTGKVKVIVVTYPDEYYACPVYLSTRTIVNEFRARNVKDEAGLERMIVDLCEI